MARLDYFVSIELSRDTIYLTTADTTQYKTISGVSTAFYPLISNMRFIAEFESLDIAREIPNRLSMTLVNRPMDGGQSGYFNQYLGFGRASQSWDNRVITIKYGDASAWTSLKTENIYRILRGTIRHTPNEVSFSAIDIRNEHDKGILTEVFTPSAEDAAIGKYVPVVYGDFTTGAGPAGGGRLRAYVQDTSTGSCRVADHEISNLTVFRWNHSTEIWDTLTLTTQYTEDLSNGAFTLVFGGGGAYADAAAMVAAIEAGDYFTVNCKGIQTGGSRPATRPVSGGTGVYSLAADIIYDLLTEYGGAAAGDIDLTSFQTANTLSDGFSCRTAITSNLSVMRAISAMLRENNMQLFTDAGKYNLKYFEPTDAPVVIVNQSTIADNGRPEAVYDPSAIYCNRISAFYCPDPLGAGNLRSTQINDSSAQTEYGSVVNVDMQFMWLHDTSETTLSAQRMLFVRSSNNHNVSLTIAINHVSNADMYWRLRLSDIFELSDDWQYSEDQCEIRSVERDVLTGRIAISAFVISQTFPIARWSEGYTLSDLPAYWSEGATLASPTYGKWA